ncbi:MAG TPA: SDR family oxidoreductase [Enhygromyxa sp.]|nr:SDR family oxidoreductase [Enhygromyxa sp.]
MSTPTIFITGAARGIGRACAERFAAGGYFVGLYDLEIDALAASAEALADRHGLDRICHSALDVRDPTSIRAAIDHFAEHTGGRMHVLLNNAGVMHVGPFEAIEIDKHRHMIDVNFAGVVAVAHAGFGLLSDTPGARLINMSSASAIYGMPEMATYSATKHAVRGLTEALDIEWERFDIRVADVMPIFVDTELLTRTRKASASDKLGVHLQATDVAEVVWEAATSRRRRIHWPVGVQTQLAYHGSRLAPTLLERLVVRWMTKTS